MVANARIDELLYCTLAILMFVPNLEIHFIQMHTWFMSLVTSVGMGARERMLSPIATNPLSTLWQYRNGEEATSLILLEARGYG